MVIPKEKIMRSTIILLPLMLWGCSEKGNDDPGIEQSSYENNDQQTFDEDKTGDEYGDEEKEEENLSDEDKTDEEYGDEEKEDSAYEECASDIDVNASCEGSWEESICIMNNLIWWCQDGVWMNENDK